MYNIYAHCALSWKGKSWAVVVEPERLTLTHVARSSNEEQVRQNDANEIKQRRLDIALLQNDIDALVANSTMDAKTAAAEIEQLLAVRNNHVREIANIEAAERTFTRTETTTIVTFDPFVWYASPTHDEAYLWIPIRPPEDERRETRVAEFKDVRHMDQIEPIC